MNLVSGQLVACFRDTCEIYQDGLWKHLQNTMVSRASHSSATTQDAVLLIGGYDITSYETTNTTEWIPVDGSAAQPGPFTVRHGDRHCTIQISDEVIVVIGGYHTEDYATEYHLVDGTETPLTSLVQQRSSAACGVYQDAHGQQVRKSFFRYSMCFNLLAPTGAFIVTVVYYSILEV